MTLVYRSPAYCTICQSALQLSHQGVEDRVYGIAGRWDLTKCTSTRCGALFLKHDLTIEHLASFYESYSTHAPPIIESRGLKALYRRALKQIWHDRLEYPTGQQGLVRILGRILGAIPFFCEEALSRVFWLPYRDDGTVIEVGFGNAQGMAILREAGWRVCGSEMDDHCVSNAQAAGFDVVMGNFADGLFAAGSADAIVASHVIEHLPDSRGFLLEACRVLRPGGYLTLRTPNAASHDAKRFGRSWRGLEVPRHLCIHTPQSLATLAREAGFEEVTVTGTPLGGFCVQQSSEIHARRPLSPRQGIKTLFYHCAEAVRAAIHHESSSEMALVCFKPALDTFQCADGSDKRQSEPTPTSAQQIAAS